MHLRIRLDLTTMCSRSGPRLRRVGFAPTPVGEFPQLLRGCGVPKKSACVTLSRTSTCLTGSLMFVYNAQLRFITNTNKCQSSHHFFQFLTLSNQQSQSNQLSLPNPSPCARLGESLPLRMHSIAESNLLITIPIRTIIGIKPVTALVIIRICSYNLDSYSGHHNNNLQNPRDPRNPRDQRDRSASQSS